MRRKGPHAPQARGDRPACAAIITVSDTRGPQDDDSGARVQTALERAGHRVLSRAWVRDDVRAIRAALRKALGKRECDVVVLTGGTGLAPRDVTPEAVEPLLDRALPGFGEGFRAHSRAQVGAAAWLSRAGAGVARGRLVVYLPGSTGAVELALDELLVPELAHALRTLGRFSAR